MSVTYSFSGRLFRLDCVGESSALQVMNALERGLADPAFPPDARCLIDVLHSTSIASQSYTEILWIAGVLGGRSKRFGHKCAVVAPLELAEMLRTAGDAFADDFSAEAGIFSDEAEALAWLELDEPVGTSVGA